MEKITHGTAAELLSKPVGMAAVTIYCPMHKSAAPPQMTEEQIRFKNLIHKAVDQLKQRADSKDLEKTLCGMLDETLDNQQFWEEQSDSLLLCAQTGSIRLFHLPIDTEEYVAVDDNFHLAPVLALLEEMIEFYVLAVAQHTPVLLRGDLYGLYTSGVHLPETIEKALNIDEVNQKSEHARSAAGPSLGPTGFHGRGGARNPREEDRARFFRMIDNIICKNIDRSAPLILAGIDAETAEFRALSKHPRILTQTISGSYRGARPQDLSEPASAIIHDEIINTERQQAIEDFQTIRGAAPERVAISQEAINEAAEQGRIDKLLVRMLRHTTDTVRDTREAIARITFPEFALSTTVNRLANKVWQASGRIISLNDQEMPDGSAMVASLRY